jgi:multicomponent Na+:H+ antiporter subunit F
MIETAATISLTLLSVAALAALARLLRGGSVAERIVALDTLLVIVVSGLAVQAARTGEDTYLDAMVVAALLGFTGTSLVATYIERRGAR